MGRLAALAGTAFAILAPAARDEGGAGDTPAGDAAGPPVPMQITGCRCQLPQVFVDQRTGAGTVVDCR